MLDTLQGAVQGPWRLLFVGAAVLLVLLAAGLASWRVADSPIGAKPSWVAVLIALPLLVLAAKALALFGLTLNPGDPMTGEIDRLAQLMLWLAGGVIVLRGLDAFYWKDRLADSIASAARAATALVVMTVALLGGLAFAYGIAASGLLIALAVVLAALALLARPALADLAAALAFSRAPSYAVGDWLRFEDGSEGRVVAIDWRTTRLASADNGLLVLPNARAAAMRHLRHGSDDAPYADTVTLALEPTVAPDLVRRLVLYACTTCREVLTEPAPEVLLHEAGRDPYEYRIRVHYSDHAGRETARDIVLTRIRAQLLRAGILPSAMTQDLNLFQGERPPVREPEPADLLREVAVFRALTPDEFKRLMPAVKVRAMLAGEPIVQEKETGSSLFILARGVVRVTAQYGRPAAVELARLGPGDFFGEMSLLTGEPRSATVTAITDCDLLEISKSGLDPILRSRPEIVEQLARSMAERRLSNDVLLAADSGDPERARASAAHVRSYTREIVERAQRFFRI